MTHIFIQCCFLIVAWTHSFFMLCILTKNQLCTALLKPWKCLFVLSQQEVGIVVSRRKQPVCPIKKKMPSNRERQINIRTTQIWKAQQWAENSLNKSRNTSMCEAVKVLCVWNRQFKDCWICIVQQWVEVSVILLVLRNVSQSFSRNRANASTSLNLKIS